MRIGIISDVHANLPALEEAIRDLGTSRWLRSTVWETSPDTPLPERSDRADSARWHPDSHGELR